MTSVGLGLFVVLIATAVTLGRGKATMWKADVLRMPLLMYIALLGLWLGYDSHSMRIHDPCIGADSVVLTSIVPVWLVRYILMSWGRLECCVFVIGFCGGCIVESLWYWCRCLLSL